MSTCKILASVVFGTVFLACGITLLTLLLTFQGAKPIQPCSGQWGPVIYYHRGNLTYAQENTFNAVVNGTAFNGKNPEVDVMALNDGGVVLFHDSDMKRLTGKDVKTKDQSTEEVLSTPILDVIDGYQYPSKNFIPELEPVVDAVCNADGNIGIEFDMKSKEAVRQSVSIVKNSTCSERTENIVWASAYPGTVTELKNELKDNGMDHRINLYLVSGKYSFLGLKFFLKTRLLHASFSSGASILAVHKTVYDAEKDLIQEWADDGWCTEIFGITEDEIPNYDVDIYVLDDTKPDGIEFDSVTTYEDNSLGSYHGLIAAGSVFLVIGFALCVNACRIKRRQTTQEINPIESKTNQGRKHTKSQTFQHV
jgi:hypothetical protein